MPPLRDRIVELRRVPASLIDGAPWNWRTHPGEQRAVVQASIEELGIIDALKVRAMPDGRYQLFDGHLRSDLYVTISPDTLVPVLVTDLDEAEAKKANAIFDPSAAMAEADAAKLDALLKEIETDSAAIEAMLAGIIESEPDEVEGIDAPELPSGEKSPYQQMTFTLHDDQAEVVKSAIEAAKKMGPFVDTKNENSNGNALARIAEAFIGQG